MGAYQERVVQEKKELDEKLEKLATFLNSSTSSSLSTIDVQLLRAQQHAMVVYSDLLAKRIARFSA